MLKATGEGMLRIKGCAGSPGGEGTWEVPASHRCSANGSSYKREKGIRKRHQTRPVQEGTKVWPASGLGVESTTVSFCGVLTRPAEPPSLASAFASSG